MKKSLIVASGILAFAFSFNAWAGPHKGQGHKKHQQTISSVSTGNFLIGGITPLSNIGVVQQCAEGEVVIETSSTYAYLRGICEDGTDNACAGRFTSILERCANAPVPLQAGAVSGTLIRSKGLICFDESGLTCKTGATPVAELESFGVTNKTPGAGSYANSDIEVVSSSKFVFAGEQRRIQRRVSSVQSLGLEESDGSSQPGSDCLLDVFVGGDGCGVISTARNNGRR